MAYIKHNWQDFEEGGTLVTAQRLNEMEEGIETANEMMHVDVDTELSETSEKPVANNVLARALRRLTEAVNSIIQNAVVNVDTSLSTTSTNPVQNKVVTDAIRQAGGGLTPEIVQELPATGETGILYLLAVEQTEEGNLYDEYLWIPSQNRFERLGSRIAVDSDFSYTSENPLQNKKITEEIFKKLNRAGDSLGGALRFANNTFNPVGDDAQFGDRDIAGKIVIQGVTGETGLRLCEEGNEENYAEIAFDGTSTRVEKLDYEDTEEDGKYVSAVEQKDGKISVMRKDLPTPGSDSQAEYDTLNTTWLGYTIPDVFSVKNEYRDGKFFVKQISRIHLGSLDWTKVDGKNCWYAKPPRMLSDSTELVASPGYNAKPIAGYWNIDELDSYPTWSMGTDGNGTIFWKPNNKGEYNNVQTAEDCKLVLDQDYLFYRYIYIYYTPAGFEATNGALVTAEEFSADKYYRIGDYCKYQNKLYICIKEGKHEDDFQPTRNGRWIKTSVAERLIEIANDAINLKMLGWTVPKDCPIQNEVNGNTFVQKVGRVDLGSLNWTYYTGSSKHQFWSDGINSSTKKYENTEIPNAYCLEFKIKSPSWAWSDDSGLCIDSIGRLKIHTTEYSDATSFKSAMNKVYLYYELATPITMTIDGHEVGYLSNKALRDTILTNCDLLTWAISQENGFVSFRTNNTVTNQPITDAYMLGMLLKYNTNIKLIMFDMFNSNRFWVKGSNNNGTSWQDWSSYGESGKIYEVTGQGGLKFAYSLVGKTLTFNAKITKPDASWTLFNVYCGKMKNVNVGEYTVVGYLAEKNLPIIAYQSSTTLVQIQLRTGTFSDTYAITGSFILE